MSGKESDLERLGRLCSEDEADGALIAGPPSPDWPAKRIAELEVEVDLLRYHLTAVCDATEKGNACGACGEVFNTPGRAVECPIPGARDFLKDPTGTVEAVLRAVAKKAEDA